MPPNSRRQERLRRVLLLCALALGDSGCGRSSRLGVGNRELNEYVHRFQKQAAAHGIELSYGDLSARIDENPSEFARGEHKTAAGTCSRLLWPDRREIVINRAIWRTSSASRRELLVFHELGHCVLGLDHDASLDESGDPMSVMYPELFSEHVFLRKRSRYLDELFAAAVRGNQAASRDGVTPIWSSSTVAEK